MRLALYLILFFVFTFGSVYADKVTFIKTNETLDNVKTTANGRLETIVESRDGSKQILKTKDITITAAPVVWDQPVEEKPKGFFEKRFPEMAIGAMALLYLLLP